MTFDTAVNFVLDQEGGISEDPNDPGGLTNFGISQRQYPSLDIRKLTRTDATGIYKRDYWDVLHGDSLPPALAIALFDAAVNQGVSAAVRMLQFALSIRSDGIIGPETLSVVASQPQKKLLTEFIARRFNAYGGIPQFSRYGLGWSRRVAAVHALAMENL